MSFVPWPGFGPFESYDADELVSGGEKLELAGLEIDVLFTPGHSPGHVTYSIPSEQAVFSGDVLFQGSIGRTDLPGGDTQTLMRTLADLVERLPDETVVYPGHMGVTTIGQERATNPFLRELAHALSKTSTNRRLAGTRRNGQHCPVHGGRTDEAPTGLRSSQRTLAGRPGPHRCAPRGSDAFLALRPNSAVKLERRFGQYR